MTAFFRNVYRAACRFIRILAPLFTALLFLSAFFSTCYAEDMTTQKVLTRLDNPLVSLAGGALFLLFLLGVSGFVCQKPRRRLPVLLGLVLLAYVLGGCILILFSRTVPAADALSVYRAAECLANNDTSVIHPTDSYLSYYPQQIGLVSFYEPLIRLWNRIPIDSPPYHFLKGSTSFWSVPSFFVSTGRCIFSGKTSARTACICSLRGPISRCFSTLPLCTGRSLPLPPFPQALSFCSNC